MRVPTSIAALVILTACSGQSKLATFTCPNGPDVAVVYEDETAVLRFAGGRQERLTQPDPERPNFYAKPGMTWSVGFREARLNDGNSSYICDQMAG